MSTSLNAPAAEVWRLVGAFGELDRWHPWVPNCTLSADGLTRTIRLGSVAAVEVLDPSRTAALAHGYRVVESPMPIADYSATWAARPTPGGCVLEVRARFAPRGVPEEQAVAMIRGFFEAGFEALVRRYGPGP